MNRICAVVEDIHAIDHVLDYLYFNENYCIDSIICIKMQREEKHQYNSIEVHSLNDLYQCILLADEVLVFDECQCCAPKLYEDIHSFALQNDKKICQNKQNNAFKYKTTQEQLLYKTISIPAFIVTTMCENIGEQRLLIGLMQHIQALGEKVLVVAPGYSYAFFDNVIPLPCNSIYDIARGEQRVLFLNNYLYENILQRESSILIILNKGSLCNPYIVQDFESSYMINLIEMACDIDYHINVIPMNFASCSAIKNNNLRIKKYVKKKIDANIISNILFDVPNQEVYSTSGQIPYVYVNEKNSSKIVNSVEETDIFAAPLLCDSVYERIISDIIKKLKRSQASYNVL